MAHRLYWFVLVDSEGTILDKCDLDFIHSTDHLMLGFLRDEIKLKYADSVMKGIAGSQLKVYKDKHSLMLDPLNVDFILTHDIGNTVENPICVVVPIADEMNGYIYVDWNHTEVKRYLHNASYLIMDENMKKILDGLNELEKLKEFAPFISISSSSGTGKTQSAFTIYEAFKENADVFYFVVSPLDENSQTIYRVFEEPSKLLMKCVYADLELIKSKASGIRDAHLPLSISDLKNMKLYSYGFIDALLRRGFSCTDSICILPTSNTNISNLLKERNAVVILDEFMPFNDENIGYLRLLRNVVRSVYFKVVCMGTHSATSNLIEFAKQSRSNVHPWCFLFTKLPDVTLKIAQFCSLNPALNAIAQHSRPLFVEAMEMFLHDEKFSGNSEITINFIDSLLNFVNKYVLHRKPIHKNEAGLFLNACYEADQNLEMLSLNPLVNFHFAILDLNEQPTQISTSGLCNFFPSRFPNLEEDILLYLIFLGGKDNFTRSFANDHWKKILDCSRLRDKVYSGCVCE
jgi:uridine kinase